MDDLTGIRVSKGDEQQWRSQPKKEWEKYNFGIYGCWIMDEDGNLDYTPEEEYIRKENQKLVQDAIMKLPDKYREFLILFHHRNLSYQEIMDITGESLTIVKNRLYRARQMLKEELISRGKEREKYAVPGNK